MIEIDKSITSYLHSIKIKCIQDKIDANITIQKYRHWFFSMLNKRPLKQYLFNSFNSFISFIMNIQIFQYLLILGTCCSKTTILTKSTST